MAHARPQALGGRGAAALFAFVLLVLSAPLAGAEETRIALVIGNGAYRDQPLNNPPSDARLIAATLKRLGFTVIGGKPGKPLIDADQKAMKRTIRDFGEQLERAGVEAIGLFFYAGHAVQAGGKNYLIPVGAAIDREADLEIEALSADSVLAQMIYARARVNLLVLDACRNNPYRGRLRAATRGLAEMSAPRGSLIAYSTAPGEVARDGAGTNSPYSTALAQAMVQADVPVELMFKSVRTAVMQATGERQVPWESSSLIGDFYFARAPSPAPPVEPPAAAALAQPAGVGVSPRTYKALEAFKDCDSCPEMVAVPAGSFTMGSAEYGSDPRNNQGPQHQVEIARAFAIGKYEVTFDEWDTCVADGKCRGHYPLDHGWGRARRPVIMVSWDDAKAYTEWLAMKTGERYRLPTEAEWEYAARTNTFALYASAGAISTNHANFGPGKTKTTEVGLFPPNAWGLHDMQGNVWEWVEDDWHPTYDGAPPDGSVWSGGTASQNRVLRGGGWDSAQTEVSLFSRTSNRFDVRNANTGFRVAKDTQ